MIYDIAETLVNSCLDRESAKKLNRFTYDDKIWKRVHELEIMKQAGQLKGDDFGEYMLFTLVHEFVGHLQVKARAMLRRPVNPKGPTKQT